MSTIDPHLTSPPYPWFGGKSSVAAIVWQRFGDVPNYVEPFFGGGAVWRMRPHWPFDASVIRRETINDIDGFVANFWRAVQHDPDAVAHHADWIVSELDLHARGDWLFFRPESKEFVERMRSDPDYYDSKTAGWWAWFCCNWIGGLPSVEKNAHRSENGVHRRRPQCALDRGVARQTVHRRLPHLGNAGQGVARQTGLQEWMRTLADRLRYVRICCGSWDRVCGPSVTWKHGITGVFLDPPYSAEAGRANNVYASDDLAVAHAVRDWCLAEGQRKDIRICLCGYEGEGHELLVEHGWEAVNWSASGGYANRASKANMNRHREMLWFSPYCLRDGQRMLF